MRSFFKKIVISILTLEARVALKRHKPSVIAITGNVGKTSTKDAIYAVVSHAYGAGAVRKSEKSFNSEFGLPLAILGLETAWSSPSGWLRNLRQGFRAAFFGANFPEWLVLEVGADHPGDIRNASRWLHPDVVVLTRMSDIPVHVEYFKDAEEVLREKMFLAHALKPGGTIVVNADDPHFERAVRDIAAAKAFYGAKKGIDAEIVSSEISYDGEALPLPVGQNVVVRMNRLGKEKEAEISLAGVLGDHLAYPIAAACAVAGVLDIASAVPAAFRDFESPKGRMRILPGANSSAIIDDSYNSSPLASAEALKTMAKLSLKGKKVAILGDMKELGASAEKAHRDIGRLAADALHTLAVVGDMAEFIATGAIEAGMAADRVMHFESSLAAGAAIRDIIRAGDAVLVKGSQSMRMEQASKALLADPEKAADLLVRQEKEWLSR
ncbi:hypothetical protein KW799_02765 [Candidatus Parcubacteria bacterium]|nr:hypothetical protein [Candidatus Parcubacteria bacterium]